MHPYRYNLAIAVTILAFLWPQLLRSQDSDLGNWLIYIGNKKINKTWNIHHGIQYRNYNAIGDLEQLLLRTGLGYTFNDGAQNALLGYGYILSENYLENSENKVSINEHRIFQQLISKQSIGSVKLSHRYRFEQRWVSSNFKLRFRYFLALNVPFKKINNNEPHLYASAYNELFINTTSVVFDRNRLYGGLGYNFGTNLRVELGYMLQSFDSSSRDQINLITFVTF